MHLLYTNMYRNIQNWGIKKKMCKLELGNYYKEHFEECYFHLVKLHHVFQQGSIFLYFFKFYDRALPRKNIMNRNIQNWRIKKKMYKFEL